MSRRSSFYENDYDDIDIRVGRGRSPHGNPFQPIDYRTAPRRPGLYENTHREYLVPEVNIHRSTSRRRRSSTPHPVIINNILPEEHEHRPRRRSRERRRSRSRDESPPYTVRDPFRGKDYILSNALTDARLAANLGILEVGVPRDRGLNFVLPGEREREREREKERENEIMRRENAEFKRKQADEEREAQRKKDDELEKLRAIYGRTMAGSSRDEARRRLEEQERRDREDFLERQYRAEEEWNRYQRRRPRSRPRSRSRSRSRSHGRRDSKEKKLTREEYDRIAREEHHAEMEKKEREDRIRKQAIEDEKIKKIQEADKKRAQEAQLKKEHEEAVEQYKKDLAEKEAKEKLAKEEADKAYKKRVEDNMKKKGYTDQQIADFLSDKKETSTEMARPTYTRMSRKHLSVETLNKFRVDYEFDQVSQTLLSLILSPTLLPALREEHIHFLLVGKDGVQSTWVFKMRKRIQHNTN